MLFAVFVFLVCSVAGVAAQTTDAAVVQILAFEDEDLVNQGSGFYVDGAGTVVTAAHLLRRQNKIFVLGSDGERRPAAIVKLLGDADLAILRVSSSPKGGVSPATFAAVAPVKSDVLSIKGFWATGAEPERGWSLFGPERPDFIAAVQEKGDPVRAVVESASDAGAVLFAAAGRGAYGGPALNSCARVVGMVARAPGKSDEDLWKPHIIEPKISLVSSGRIATMLRDAGVTPSVAAKDCKAEVASKEKAASAKAAAAEKKRKAAERKAKQAEKKAKEAEKKAAEADKEKEKAKKETERVKQDTTKAVEGLSKRVDEKSEALKAEQEQRKRYMIYGGIAVLTLLVLSFLLWSKRKRDLRIAEAEIEAANARFNDCLLEGTDANGAPLALRVSGRDLMKSANGVVFGRNPDMADTVIADDTVSRRHARIMVRDNRLYLEDLGSTGGTRINGETLDVDGGPANVATNDVIELGGVKLTLKVLEG